jgi:hypothetical protein
MRTDCIVKLSKLQISELNTLVQKETSGDVEGKPPPSDKLKEHSAATAPSRRRKNREQLPSAQPRLYVREGGLSGKD